MKRMANPAHRRATYEDLLKVPDHLVAEIVDGELFTSPRPAIRHANASSTLGADLHVLFQRGRGGPGGWWILDEPELHLEADVLVPDIAGWRRERMQVPPDAPAIDLAPDWICEVVSPATSRLDRVRKLPRYSRHRVGYAWLVDPQAQTLEVYRLENERWVLLSSHEGTDKVRAEPFDAVEIELGALWTDAS